MKESESDHCGADIKKTYAKLTPILNSSLGHRLVSKDTGIVDDNVNSTKGVNCGLDDFLTILNRVWLSC